MTDEDSLGRNVSLQFSLCYVIAQQHPCSVNAVAWALTTSSCMNGIGFVLAATQAFSDVLTEELAHLYASYEYMQRYLYHSDLSCWSSCHSAWTAQNGRHGGSWHLGFTLKSMFKDLISPSVSASKVTFAFRWALCKPEPPLKKTAVGC